MHSLREAFLEGNSLRERTTMIGTRMSHGLWQAVGLERASCLEAARQRTSHAMRQAFGAKTTLCFDGARVGSSLAREGWLAPAKNSLLDETMARLPPVPRRMQESVRR
jgi:hypothetical protein